MRRGLESSIDALEKGELFLRAGTCGKRRLFG